MPNDSRLEVFLFGSSLIRRSPKDIDLLVVYDQDIIKMSELRRISNSIVERLMDRFRRPIDLVRLSSREAEQNPFISDEGCLRVWPSQ